MPAPDMLEKLKLYAPAALRMAMALVFLWFSANQLLFPDDWIGYIPLWAESIMPASTILLINALFEAVFGIMLLLGLFPRISAALLGLHLLGISVSLGYNAIAIRDYGLALATLSAAMNGPDRLCIMQKF